MEAVRLDRLYSYADYCTWDDDLRWELIDGVPYLMSPAPSWDHQAISMALAIQIGQFLRDKPCKVFAAPFDVRLNANGADDTVVQPDIVVICDESKISRKSCDGAPDMVVEILSPSTSRRDVTDKLRLYERFGVREYWIVDPERKIVQTNILESGRYFIKAYTDADTAPIHVLEGCVVDLKAVFES